VHSALPVKRADDLKSHIFLSFSHEDKGRADALSRTLVQNGIAVWIDYRNIVPGTPDWETAIREGLNKSFAVVVLASPQSQRSQYVRAELALARTQNLPIYPLWIEGDNWPDCIALDLIYTQYIDVREQREPEGIKQLCSEITTLSRNRSPHHIVIEDAFTITVNEFSSDWNEASMPPGYINVLLDEIPKKHKRASGTIKIRGAFLRLDVYNVIGQLLDDIFIHHIQPKYKPFTYGSRWLLLGKGRFGGFDRALAPWAWLEKSREPFLQWAQSSSLSSCNVRPGSVWMIGMASSNPFIGIASRNHKFLDIIRNHPKALWFAWEQDLLEPVKGHLSYDPELIAEVLWPEHPPFAC
jgi:hypothetical protein